MFLENIFESERVIGIRIIVVIKIVIRIITREESDSCVVSAIEAAMPVLLFWIVNRTTKERDIIRVLTEPRRIRNCSRFNLPVIVEPIAAAWLLPSPGKSAQIGETNIVAKIGLINSFLSM